MVFSRKRDLLVRYSRAIQMRPMHVAGDIIIDDHLEIVITAG